MNIRTRFTLIFFSIVIVILTMICVSIYLLSSNYRNEDFHRRLKNRATNTAKLLVEVAEVNADLIRRMEQNNPASLPNQYIVIFNDRNDVVYSSEAIAKIPVDVMLLDEIRAEEEIHFNIENYEALGFVFIHDGNRLTIVAGATDVYGLDALTNLRNILIAIFLISLVLVSLLGWFFSGRVLKPISRIVKDVSHISEMNLNRRVDEGNGTDELAKLAITFNKMLSRLQNAFTAQKSFIANASHEIKTPITVMSGQIEVTLLHDRDKSYYIKVLRSVLETLKGLNKLSTHLLLLAQTNSAQNLVNPSLIRIDDVLWELKDEIMKVHPGSNVEIELDLGVNHESLSVYGDEQLLKVAMINLLDNGCKYSSNKTVHVNVRTTSDEYVIVEFHNDGPGISPEIIDKIFDPFFRASADKNVKGFGIGLSLVKRISDLHGGEIAVESVPHQITKFRLELPTAAKKDLILI